MRISHEFELEIFEDNAGMRLDKALSMHSEIESRSQATRLIDIGCVSISEKKVGCCCWLWQCYRGVKPGGGIMAKCPPKGDRQRLLLLQSNSIPGQRKNDKSAFPTFVRVERQ